MKKSKNILSVVMIVVMLIASANALIASAESEILCSGIWNYTVENDEEPLAIELANIHYNHNNTPASGSCNENISWYYDGTGTLTISGNGAMPKYHKGNNAPWNDFASKVATVEFTEGITSIDGFYNCKTLNTVILPESIKHLESCAFCWDYTDDTDIIYKGMPEQWSNITFGKHSSADSMPCSCYDMNGLVHIDNKDFKMDSLDVIIDGPTNVELGETTYVYADILQKADGEYPTNYFLPVDTYLEWFAWDECFVSDVYDDCACAMTAQLNGTDTVYVSLVDSLGCTIYNENEEPLEVSLEFTCNAGIFDYIRYFFRTLIELFFSSFSFDF